jgi:DNA-binding response OmpR family regulator
MSEKKVIFHVDDEPEMLRLVKMILEKHGYIMESALNGQEAVERLASLRPDLILLDIAMPILDGWGVQQQMEEFAHLAGVPVVLVTAKLGTADAVHGLHDIEADAYLTKPFNPNELVDTVEKILANN